VTGSSSYQEITGSPIATAVDGALARPPVADPGVVLLDMWSPFVWIGLLARVRVADPSL
jgi:hypothetical protein